MEAVGATASIVGIVSFGLGLAKSLQAFIETVIEAEDSVTLIVAEVNATALTLKRLQDFIEQDKAASKELKRVTVFNTTGIKEVGDCALMCHKIYVQIIVLIEKASGQQAPEGGSKEAGRGSTQAFDAEDSDLGASTVRLEAFSKKVTELGRRIRWPWLEPRIKRCQEHLGRLKVNLMLSLQVFFLAESLARSSVGTAMGAEDESELRDRAEILRRRMMSFRANKGPPTQSERQTGGSDDGESDNTSIRTSIYATTLESRDKSGSVDADGPADSTGTSATASSESPYRSPGTRLFDVLRALYAIIVHVRNRTERRAVFRADSTSATFQAFLVDAQLYFPVQTGNISTVQPTKLPFGHRRLTREVKRALRKANPWDILLVLDPPQRQHVERAIRQVQLETPANMSICLVAIDIDGADDLEIADIEVGDLHWTRMVLFFRQEPVSGVAGPGRHQLGSTMRHILTGRQDKIKKELRLQEHFKHEHEHIARDQAEIAADRKIIDEDKKALEAAKKVLEDERLQMEKDKMDVDIRDKALREAKESVFKKYSSGAYEQDSKLKKVFEEEYASREDEAKKACAAESSLPVRFKDAVGRKFNFPFHLVQSWQGMEGLIREAFAHVDTIGPHVQEGRYDLMDSEDQIFLPSAWAETIKPGASVVMRMWPMDKIQTPPSSQPIFPPSARPGPNPPAPMFGGKPAGPPATGPNIMHMPMPRMRRWMPGPPVPSFGQPPPPPPGMRPRRPTSKEVYDRAHHKTRRAKRPVVSTSSPGEARRTEDPNHARSDGEKDVEDIDKELGLQELEVPRQVASKGVDELLAAWTNLAGGRELQQPSPTGSLP